MQSKKQEKQTLKVLMNSQEIIHGMIHEKTKDGIITRHKIAVLSGIHPCQINEFMKGTKGLNCLTLQKIATALSKID